MRSDATAKQSSIRRYAKGAVLSREGSTAKELFIVLQGSIGVYKNYNLPTQNQAAVLNQGSFYGEMHLFLGREQEDSLVALSDVTVLQLNRRTVNDLFASQPDMTFTVIEGICKKLLAANEELVKFQGQSSTQASSGQSSLFPEGHGSYTLSLDNRNDELLYEQKCICPLCGQSFGNLAVLSTRLRLDRTDKDLRSYYKDIEPLHYDVVTCPNCFYSASGELFPTASRNFADSLNSKVGPYKLDIAIHTGADRDTFTVFAGYYLAVISAAICFDDHQLITAGLWQKLSRLYRDCEDTAMMLYASKMALKDYLYAYEHFNINEKRLQSLCFILGDLSQRLGDLDAARTYFYNAKTNKEGTMVMRNQADGRLEEIKALKAGQ